NHLNLENHFSPARKRGPPISPRITALPGLTKPASGVMIMSPMSTPLVAYIKSGIFLIIRYLKYMIDKREEAAARKVVTTTVMAELLNARTLPGLKPNHPIQRNSIDRVSHPLFSLYGT